MSRVTLSLAVLGLFALPVAETEAAHRPHSRSVGIHAGVSHGVHSMHGLHGSRYHGSFHRSPVIVRPPVCVHPRVVVPYRTYAPYAYPPSYGYHGQYYRPYSGFQYHSPGFSLRIGF